MNNNLSESKDILSQDFNPITDISRIEGEFTFDNCEDIHIGPRYDNSNNIIIHQNISVPSEKLANNLHSTFISDLQQNLPNLVSDKAGVEQRSRLRILITLATCSALIMLAIIAVIIYSTSNPKPPNTNEGEIHPTQNSEDYPLELHFVERDGWGASPPLSPQVNNSLPVGRVIFIHTASSSTCSKFTACAQAVRDAQELHMDEDHDWGDIGYNFVIGSDNYIYVGRGWDKVGVHTAGFNTGSLAVAFIGNFRDNVPNDYMISSAKRLLEFGVKRKKLSSDYQLFGHCQLLDSFPYSPGKNILNVIKGWEHWNNTNINYCKK